MNLLITGAWQDAKQNISRVQEMGHEVIFAQQEREPLPCDPEWVEGVVCNGLFLYHPMDTFPNLRYIQLTSAGFDRLDVNSAKQRGITLRNARGVYSVPMAEYALGGVLQLYKNFAFFRENQKRHRWEKRRDLLELAGKQVCILGCGSIGSECARRFQSFGCTVTGIATAERVQMYFEAVKPLDMLDRLLPEMDIVVLALPLTEQTRHLMNKQRLASMKPGAVLVNIARGAIVDTDALTEALKENRLGGAVLDVFEEEPLPENSPLWELENVILTPHNSFVGDGNRERLNSVILENLCDE